MGKTEYKKNKPKKHVHARMSHKKRVALRRWRRGLREIIDVLLNEYGEKAVSESAERLFREDVPKKRTDLDSQILSLMLGEYGKQLVVNTVRNRIYGRRQKERMLCAENLQSGKATVEDGTVQTSQT